MLPSQIGWLQDQVHANGRDPHKEIAHYYRNESYTDPSNFIRVWNDGTPEFEQIRIIFERLPFAKVYDTCAHMEPSERGNRQRCYGFSVENISERCPFSGVALPAKNPSTDDNADIFVLMSSLSALIGVSFPQSIDLSSGDTKTLRATFRRLAFAATIHPRNIIEGTSLPLPCRNMARRSRYTNNSSLLLNSLFVTGVTVALNDPFSQKLEYHFDRHNPSELDYNMLLGASRVVVDTATNPAQAKRAAVLAYGRKGNSDAVERVGKTYSFSRHVVDWHTSLPEYRKAFDPSTFFRNVGDYGVLDGIALIGRPNADKCVWLSTFVDVFLRLHACFDLSLEESLEILYPVAFLTEPYKYWIVLQSWIYSGCLPLHDSLFIAFCNECQSRFGGFCSGQFPRMMTSSGSAMDHDKVASSLRNLHATVLKYNRTESVSQDTYKKLVKEVENGVHKAGQLTVQHLCHVLILCGIIHHPALAIHSVVAVGSNHAKRIKQHTGCNDNEIDSVLRSVSASLGSTTRLGENSCCESTRTNNAYDFYILGQSIITVIYNVAAGAWRRLRYFPDGSETSVGPFRPGPGAPRGEWEWWLPLAPIPAGQVFPGGRKDVNGKKKAFHVFPKYVFANSEESAAYRDLFFSGPDTLATQELVRGRFQSLLDKDNRKCPPASKRSGPADVTDPLAQSVGIWSTLCEKVVATYHSNASASSFAVLSSSQVAALYKKQWLLAINNHKPCIDVTVVATTSQQENSESAAAKVVTTSIMHRNRLATTRKRKSTSPGLTFSYYSSPPRGIDRNLVSAATLRTAIGNWKSLDLVVAASTCGARERLGRPLKSKDVMCHDDLCVSGSDMTGYYASLLDYEFGTEDCLMSIGTGHLGWSVNTTNMARRLLFRRKQQAIDHLLLCIILFDSNGHKWRSDWCHRLFQNIDPSSVVHVGKNHAKGREKDMPLFSLVPCKWKGWTDTHFYAVFLNAQSGKDEVIFFTFGV